MNHSGFVSVDSTRIDFSRAMSDMYKHEVPLYGTLMELVAKTNECVLAASPAFVERLTVTGEIHRLGIERHGAIRVGTAQELATLRRLFAVMGMEPVGYYDLTPAGVPVHATAFRPVNEKSLELNPFRVFTSLLRLGLITDEHVRNLAQTTLAERTIFTPRVLELIDKFEQQNGLNWADSAEFVNEALETFRWHSNATVTLEQYQSLSAEHRLIADVVAFRGPHINHLTPRTLDIDTVQLKMPDCGIVPKAVIEGPPKRECPILLRQTSFKALEEPITFKGQTDSDLGSHSARFGEIEQRGVALTPKGRALYDRLLNTARDRLGEFPNESNAKRYVAALEEAFAEFPDSYDKMRKQGLAYFKYIPAPQLNTYDKGAVAKQQLEALIDGGHVRYEPIVYEDFLPVSAAGIFQSNLGDDAQSNYATSSSQEEFEAALGVSTINELKLYADTQRRSITKCALALGIIELN
ncbi:DUF1338 family protein [Pseudomonas sp. CCM 7893]|uniref:2-oxoadipate dioxygenase/decarboxylase n=1 Tax=Pseudomonas spelaei TaxID=1055469 RepID=A0A6I3WES6_9PSED|nr:VOC family protein [Pseudomonas spelaei]MUF08268.1 DUF1338 family protein [Pseudomonas spelaei]